LEEKNFVAEVFRVAEGDLPKIELKVFDLSTGKLVTTNRSGHALLVQDCLINKKIDKD
jgi:hypothetical protein